MAENSMINALLRGQGLTNKLKELLAQHKLPPEVPGLVEEISAVFSEVVAMSQNLATSSELLHSTGENGEMNSSKKRRTQSAPKYGCRKRAHANLCKKVLSRSMDDGFTWRKYGQKEIFSAKHPRSYFRCTHKYDQNCLATRQVQQSEKQPNMYEITYFGEHVCKQATKHIKQESTYVINFDSDTKKLVQNHDSSPNSLASIIHEHEEEVMSDQTSSGCFTSSDIFAMESIPNNSFDFEPDGASLEFDIESIFSFAPYESLLQL